MNTFISTLPELMAAMACFKRIGSYLRSDVRRDHRLPLLSHNDSTAGLVFEESNSGLEMNIIKGSDSSAKRGKAMISAQDASFSWSAGADSVVRNLTFEIQRGQLCFLIGPVGCGKSTLLKGLLGETPSSEGFVYSNASGIAFVDQVSRYSCCMGSDQDCSILSMFSLLDNDTLNKKLT